MDVSLFEKKHIWHENARLNFWRDYSLSWVLYGFWRTGLWEVLVMKGGSCIKKVYFPNYRISTDLDYNLIAHIDPDVLYEKILQSLEIAEMESPTISFLPDKTKIIEKYGKKAYAGEVVDYVIASKRKKRKDLIKFKEELEYRLAEYHSIQGECILLWAEYDTGFDLGAKNRRPHNRWRPYLQNKIKNYGEIIR